MLSKYLSKFPDNYNPNDQQIELIKKVEDAFTKGHKFVICAAPTGSGKSFLARTLGNVASKCTPEFKQLITSYDAFRKDYMGNYSHEVECLDQPPHGTFALTITKSLQDQYYKLFDDSYLLKGKSNYQCGIDVNVDVENAPCLLTPKMKEGCWSNNICPYYNARNAALINEFAVLNYKMFLSLPKHVKRKNFIICDEAAELEDELIKQFTAFIDPDRLKMYGVKVPYLYTTDHDSVLKWQNQVMVAVSEYINILIERNNNKATTLTVTEKVKLNWLSNLHRTLSLIDETWDKCEYICQREGKTVKLTPFKVDTLSKYIFDHADNVLLMSATIVDHKNYAKSLGITEYKFIEVDSTFDAKKAPIYVSTGTKLNHANMEKMLPKLVDQIESICESHKNDKGMIHTHTMQITQYLQKKLKSSRFLFRDSESKNEAILSSHFKSKDATVIVSPSMTHGVDLKDDLARFQIIVKAGYLPLGDLRVKRLFDEDKIWYTNKMLGNLVQACGRGVRNKEDHCVTYILDGAIYEAIINNKNKLPKYFLDRFV